MADRKLRVRGVTSDVPTYGTPLHDELTLWLDRNAATVIESLTVRDWRPDVVENLQQRAASAVSLELQKRRVNIEPDVLNGWSGLGTPPPKPPLRITEKVWEGLVTNGHGRIAGFIDLQLRCAAPCLELTGVARESLTSSRPSLTKDALPAWSITDRAVSISFEVKPTIPSLGELIRQVRVYQQYVQPLMWRVLDDDAVVDPEYLLIYVVSPDDRFVDILREQGIGFIHCPVPQGIFVRPYDPATEENPHAPPKFLLTSPDVPRGDNQEPGTAEETDDSVSEDDVD